MVRQKLANAAEAYAKPGLLAPVPAPFVQTTTSGWASIFSENFDNGFPPAGPNGVCQWELRSSKPAQYLWGADIHRTYNASAKAAWPMSDGALGKQLIPTQNTYPENVTTQIVCKLANLQTSTLKNILVEFALWLDKADNGDYFFFGFNTGEPTFNGWTWTQTPVDQQGQATWQRIRFYYPELAAKVAANQGHLEIM